MTTPILIGLLAWGVGMLIWLLVLWLVAISMDERRRGLLRSLQAVRRATRKAKAAKHSAAFASAANARRDALRTFTPLAVETITSADLMAELARRHAFTLILTADHVRGEVFSHSMHGSVPCRSVAMQMLEKAAAIASSLSDRDFQANPPEAGGADTGGGRGGGGGA